MAGRLRTAFLHDSLFGRHDTGEGHPERPQRLDAILERTKDLPLIRIEPRDATVAELETVHAEAYPALIRQRVESGASRLDADTTISADSYAAAVRAAGAALRLGEAWLGGEIDAGFAAVRPPGHHACPARPMGFCLFNNVALLARFLHGRGKRVCVVDWDVHHGNGTQEILWGDAEIGFCSLHQFPFYPGTGTESETGAGNVLNVPLTAGCDGDDYRSAFDSRVLPWIESRAPEVILVSAGFDAHARDPLAEMLLDAEDYAWFTRALIGRPILSLLEGGYDLQGLGDSVRAHLEALLAG
jgi:acetoin utilization deacetylase AcuC-like enzyme